LEIPGPPALNDDGDPAGNHPANDGEVEPFDDRTYPDEHGDGPDLAFGSWLADRRPRPAVT
jgi:hypothetical protein